MRRATDKFHLRGVTLVEMIVVISVTGVLVAMVSLFGQNQIAAYLDTASRAALADAADTALRRISREVQSALPNSVRVSGNAVLEYVPVRDGGRYRVGLTALGTGDPLDVSSPGDTTFDVLGPAVTAQAGDRLVIYNLGQTGSDVYDGSNSRALNTLGSLNALGFAGAQFPFDSPQHRFQIVGGPVSYQCDLANRVLRRRWCYNFQAAQPVVFGGLPVHPACAAEQSAILVDGVTACVITYTPGVMMRNGLVTLALTLTQNGESATLMHQVEVLNTP